MSVQGLLRCPRCESERVLPEGDLWNCEDCTYQTFSLQGIPWVFADPEASLAQWRNRFELSLQSLSRDIKKCEEALNCEGLLEMTRRRLQRLKKSKQKHMRSLRELLGPLNLDLSQTLESHLALKTQLPMSQTLMGYYANVHRDWSWGDVENRRAVELICEQWTSLPHHTVFFLGAGGSRLAYDLQQKWRPQKTVAVDINPLLLFIAKRMASGEKFQMVEFPLAPVDFNHLAVEQELSAPSKGAAELEFLFADVMDLPLRTHSADVIVTPWLIDIIPQDLDIFLRQINRVLKPGGQWINFGSFAFHHSDLSLCYSKEEILELARGAGFEIEKQRVDELPYLNSPYSCQRRQEQVLTLSAKKVYDVEEYQSLAYLPSWLSDATESIPQLEDFSSYAFINQVHFEVLTAVDGQRSICDIAQLLSEKYKMPPAQAQDAVRTFFTKVYEENLFQSIS